MSRNSGFTDAQKAAILARDPMCQMIGCGKRSEVANHRANRGSGGFLGGNRISNGCGLCHFHNMAIEADADVATLARIYRLKISKFANPERVPMSHREHGRIWLHDDGSWSPCAKEDW